MVKLSLACVVAVAGVAMLALAEGPVVPAAGTSAVTATTRTSRADGLLAAFANPSDPRVFVVAHRGDWRFYPENSLEGIRHAIEVGSDMIETDLRRTKDGHFVIMHDKTLERTTTGKGAVSDFTLEELAGLKLKDALGRPTRHRIPTLEEVLDEVRGRSLIYLDKTEDCIDEVDAVVRRKGMSEHAFFYGRRSAVQLGSRWGALAGRLRYVPKIDASVPDASGYVRDLNALLRPAVYILEFDRDDSPVLEDVGVVRAAGARVWVSPIDPLLSGSRTDERAMKDPEGSWGFLLSHGVTVFCTDRPAEMVSYLRAKHLHD